MLWIMGDVVNADQFESVTEYSNLGYEYSLSLTRSLARLLASVFII